MKVGHVLVLGILVFAGLTPQFSVGATAPVVGEVSFNLPNNSTVGPNDLVWLRVNISHSYLPNDVSVWAQLIIEYSNGNYTDYQYADYLRLTYNGSSGLYEANFTIVSYWAEGILSVRYVDVNTPDGYYYYSSGFEFMSPTLVVFGTVPDVTPPQLLSLNSSLPNGSVLGPNDTISFTVSLTDNQSGIASGYLDIFYQDGNSTYFVETLYYGSITPVQNYTDTRSFTVSPYSYSGTYFLYSMTFSDVAGNWITYYENDLNFSFVVNGTTPDSTPPSLLDLDILSPNTQVGGDLEVWLSISDDVSGISYGWVDIIAWSSATNETMYIGYGNFNSNGVTMANFSIIATIDSFYDVTGFDFVYVGTVGIIDAAGNSIAYTHGVDFMSPMVPLIANPPPVLNSIWVDSPIHRAGEIVVFGMQVQADGPALQAMNDSIWIEAVITETRPDGSQFNTYSYSYTNGTLDTYFIDYFIGYSTPSNTSIYISSLLINDGYNMVYLLNGVNMTSPMVGVYNEEPSDEYIEISISPSYSTVEEGTAVNFNITITSFFRHNMPNVILFIETIDPNGNSVNSTSYLDLMGRSTVTLSRSIFFSEAGHYVVIATLFDDIGAPWSASADVEVTKTTTPPDNPTDNPTDDPTDSPNDNSTTPSDNTTSSSLTPTFEIPGLEGLPGFDLFITLLSIMAVAFGIRKRKRVS